jgi:hypothetical protein
MRQLGAVILAGSVLVAGVLYWWETRSARMADGQVLAGYERQRNYEMGVMYGRGGRDLMNALDAVDSPSGHAVLMVGVGIIGGLICFFRARAIETDESR